MSQQEGANVARLYEAIGNYYTTIWSGLGSYHQAVGNMYLSNWNTWLSFLGGTDGSSQPPALPVATPPPLQGNRKEILIPSMPFRSGASLPDAERRGRWDGLNFLLPQGSGVVLPPTLPPLKLWQPRLGGAHAATVDLLMEDPALQEFPALSNLVTAQFNHALRHAQQGNYQAYTANLNRAGDLTSAIGGTYLPLRAQTLYNGAWLAAATDHWEDALDQMQQAAEIDDRVIAQLFTIHSEAKRLKQVAVYWRRLSRFLALVAQHPESAKARRAGLDLVLRRKALVFEALAAQRDMVLRQRHPELKAQLDRLADLKQAIGEKTLARLDHKEPATEQAYAPEISQLQNALDQLEAELGEAIPELNRALEHNLRHANRESIAAALPEGSALIEFVRFDGFDFHLDQPEQYSPFNPWNFLAFFDVFGLFQLARDPSPWRPARYVAFVLRAHQPNAVGLVDLGEAAPIDALVVDFHQAIAAGGRHLRPVEAAREQRPLGDVANKLYAAVFEPLLSKLKGCTRLFVSPDGDLAQLPFEVLPCGDQRYLIDDYTISYLSAGRDVLRFNQPTTCEPALPLVVAAPDFDLRDGGVPSARPPATSLSPRSRDLDWRMLHFDPLPGAEAEGRAIAALFQIQPLLGAAAREAQLKAHHSPVILHLATHGFFLDDQSYADTLTQTPENPLLRSGLALAGANNHYRPSVLPADAEDGLLNGYDVSGLDLLDTEIVVLSACKTARGTAQVGEGVFGLRRAFVLAGARTLVMSLWNVSDRATQELMVNFYQNLRTGQSRVDALREAQRTMKAKYPDPCFWGAFICQGDPGSLTLAA